MRKGVIYNHALNRNSLRIDGQTKLFELNDICYFIKQLAFVATILIRGFSL